LGDLYMTLLDEAADLIEDLAEMEFQLKGNLSDNDQGFVSLVMEDFEFTLNYHEDENRDLMVANGTLRIDRTPLTFDATIGNEILLNYQAANAHGTVTAVVLPNGRALSLSGVHYVTRGDGQDNLEGLWSADLAIQENGFILAADLDENYRCFIDFIFQQDPATGLLTYASLGYQDVNQEHLLTLLPIDENGWRLSYTQSQQGQAQGAITLTAAPGTQQLPLKPDTLSTLSLDDAITMLQLGEGAANP
ncbi:MAG: hypothetical protein IJ461_04375, partial [Clostridia bacterium]|nr:hypothetical protein [Clostridia bacterium]